MSKFADYPYANHTNNELQLMLDGTKPLAVFAVDNVKNKMTFTLSMAQSDQDFETHVASGFLHLDTMQLSEVREHDGVELVFDYYAYTLQGEEWRAKAYFELIRMMKHVHWCANLERLEGTLLGYTDEQNDYHIKKAFNGTCESSLISQVSSDLDEEPSETDLVIGRGEAPSFYDPDLEELKKCNQEYEDQKDREEIDQLIQNVVEQKERGERER